jgi:putative DNA primase/helicase
MLELTGEAPAHWKTRSHLLWGFIHSALRKGLDDYVIVDAVLGAAQGSSIGDHVRENGGEPYVKSQIERALNAAPKSDSSDGPIIRWAAGTLDKVWRLTERTLIDAGVPVYVRGGRLVQPLWRWEKSAGERDALTMLFVPYNVARLGDVAAHQARVQYQKFNTRSNKWVNVDPPNEVMERLIVIGHWSFPSVIGLVNSPTMRRDGTLLVKEGYDPATQLWYKSSGGIDLPLIPDRPTREDAKAALKKLDELLGGFPFEDDTSRAAALAALMTPVLRAAMDIAPLFLITAPEPRTGKTKLVYLCAVVATGRNPVATAGSEKPEEMEKRIETAALSGRPILHFNNLPNGMTLESAGLSQMLTEGEVVIRKLGVHEEGTCDCRATTVFANGNNVTVSADLVLRTVAIRLDAQSERPEERTFEFDPIERVRADRGGYLAAIFTIAKAFMGAGEKPKAVKVVAGFEQWSRLVQQPLMWLGMPDPLGNRETLRALDDKEQELDRILDVLRKYQGDLGEGFTVAALVRLASEWGAGDYLRPDLRELMLRDGKINERSFGRLLSRHRDRWRGGWCVTFARIELKVSVYKLVGRGGSPSTGIGRIIGVIGVLGVSLTPSPTIRRAIPSRVGGTHPPNCPALNKKNP